MSILEAKYDSEGELQNWVFSNILSFLPTCHLISGFQIKTSSGKAGVPDGFAFDFTNREWYIIECELLSHGVWPHIAEQITRFVVAQKNPESLRTIRDKLLEDILKSGNLADITKQLNTSNERLLQQIELFIESVQPTLVIFIDESNKDLEDMTQALDVPTRVFRIKKFLVNKKPEYFCPDRNEPVLVTEPTERTQTDEYDIIELLGGGKLESSSGRFKCYKLNDESIVYIKKSKYYEKNDYYWYAITPAGLEYTDEFKITHVIFIMGEFGFVKVPVNIVKEFIANTGVSNNLDGSIKHFHLLISHGPKPELFWSNEKPKFQLADYFQSFE